AIKNTILTAEIEGTYRISTNPRTQKSFGVGDKVSQNEIIIRLDNPEYENNIKIESQRLNLDISGREFEKQKSLYDKGGVTLRELKNSERTYIEADYVYKNAIIQLQKMKIKVPFTGVIIDLPYYTPGTKVIVNQKMVELMDFSKLYAEVFYPAKELNRIQIGQLLRMTHYSLTNDTLWGEITQVAPALNPDTRSFKAAIHVDNDKHLLRPGMFVKVETIVARKDSVVVIPRDIILSKRQGKTVFIVDKGAAFERVISSGLENADQVEVLEGLKEGDRLVIKGFESLRNRSKVKIVR
ncbi:MAG: efflux RND transporter periplasmic adaptor subunit, partial [Calditrichia bacterium]|nr:efflux RND transporter periplasmic adaptor subunit [Calditrichia bacterium]